MDLSHLMTCCTLRCEVAAEQMAFFLSAPFRLTRRLRIRKVKRLAQGHKASKVEELSLKPESHDSRPQRKKGGGKKADSTQ